MSLAMRIAFCCGGAALWFVGGVFLTNPAKVQAWGLRDIDKGRRSLYPFRNYLESSNYLLHARLIGLVAIAMGVLFVYTALRRPG